MKEQIKELGGPNLIIKSKKKKLGQRCWLVNGIIDNIISITNIKNKAITQKEKALARIFRA